MIRVTSGISTWIQNQFGPGPEAQQAIIDNEAIGGINTAIRALQGLPENHPFVQNVAPLIQQLQALLQQSR